MSDRIMNSSTVTCGIVQDLAPLVADGVASEESREAVMSHIASCKECEALMETLASSAIETKNDKSQSTPAFVTSPKPDDQKIMAYIRRRAVYFIALVTLLGAAAGVMMTATSLQFQNFLIMPLVGALSYACFKEKGLLSCPAVFVMTFLHAAVSSMLAGDWSDFSGFLIYGVIYVILILVGICIGALLTTIAAKMQISKNNALARKKAILKIGAGAAALILITGILFVYNAFCGNFISAMIAKHRVSEYITRTYPSHSYQISPASYDFKTGGYTCRIIDPDSADRSFTAGTSSGGNVYDTYQDVLDMTTTLTRLEMAYRDALDPLIDSHFTDENEFGYPTIFFGNEDIDRSGLTYDMTVDPKHMPVPTCVVLSLKTDGAQSLQRTQALAVRLAMEGYQVDYWSYSDQEGHYFEIIPTEQLLAASSSDDLKEFQLEDNMK